jgi:hypothetical protein
LALLAHVGPRTICSNSWSRLWDAKFSPHPERKPNTDETRNYSKMFGSLRSPPPAANGNRSEFRCPECLCLLCSYGNWVKHFYHYACVDMYNGLLHSRSYGKNWVHTPFVVADAPPTRVYTINIATES